MPEAVKQGIAVCATGSSEVQSLSELIAGLGRWQPVPVLWPSETGLEKAWDTVRGSVVCVSQLQPALAHKLRNRPAGSPLIAIGSEELLSAQPSCWLARRPAPGLFSALLNQLIPPELPSAGRMRRKSDLIVGESKAIRDVLRTLDRIAGNSAPVLVTGESGTGKELVARALHYSSPRSAYPFLAINCAAIPESLFEAELFGYTRGAFTGAVAARAGGFEAAEGGTLFLDEIGELPRSMQSKLLRVLETGEVTRLGSNEPRKLDVRVVTATNRDLEKEVQLGRFRQDLFYRVKVLALHLPPLRQRPEDIPAIAVHQINVVCEREARLAPAMSSAAVARLLRHPWPGNVRELINVLQRAVLMAEDSEIHERHLDLGGEGTAAGDPGIPPYHQAKASFEQQYYERLLRSAAGNVSLAAKLAEKTRKEIYDALKRFGMDAEGFRGNGGTPPE
ncbi:MAG: sigma-54 dependent transcriptional regulator [Myxococcota bacterium]|nr:sigma-54 dependent transcriptional regulator [Myxococcota bacterium]